MEELKSNLRLQKAEQQKLAENELIRLKEEITIITNQQDQVKLTYINQIEEIQENHRLEIQALKEKQYNDSENYQRKIRELEHTHQEEIQRLIAKYSKEQNEITENFQGQINRSSIQVAKLQNNL